MNLYTAYTPWKKLKKLFLISKGIIDTYGLQYFFYVVNLELKKQGLSVFSSDPKPIHYIVKKPFNEKYHLFLKTMNEKLSNTNYNFIKYPNILFILFVNSKNISDVKLSISSIQNQLYERWTVVLVLNDKNLEKGFEQFVNSSNISLTKDFSLKNTSSKNFDFYGFLTPGIVFNKYAILEFVKNLNEKIDSDILYCDHDQIDDSKNHFKPFFKPDWSPYLFYSFNYLSPFYLIKKTLVEKCTEPISQKCYDFDILLQCSMLTNNVVAHIPKPLVSLSNTEKISSDCHKSLLSKHFERLNVAAKVENGIAPNTFRIKYSLIKTPKVSIIIPTKNNFHILSRCISSIEKKTNYKNWEIILINNSDETIEKKIDSKLKNYLESLPYTIVEYEENFNFSKMNNKAVQYSTGEILLFLNDDTKVIDPYWLDELVSIVLQKDVGVVGPKLIYSDNTIQHVGMAFLKTGSGFHPFMKEHENSPTYNNMINVMRECLAVTGACLMTTKKLFDQVGGFDNRFDAYYGDSDLCLKIHKAGFRVVFTPFTKLLHEGSFSINRSGASYYAVESHLDFIQKWPFLEEGDPFYNVNLGLDYAIDILD